MPQSKINILGVNVDNVNFEQTLEKIGECLNTSKTNYIVTPNPEIILAAQKDDELKEILNNADLALPDGTGLKFASRFKIKQTVTGTDIFLAILEKYKDKKYKFIINQKGLSSKEEIYKKAEVQIDEENPDFIFIGLGCPAQEKWIKENLDKYPSTRVIMTIGGGFDFLTGKQKRAPRWMRKLGLEWLWRVIKQPKRIIRIFNATIIFPLKTFFSK